MCVLMMLSFCIGVSAAGKPEVYSGDVTTTPNEEFLIPVKLKNNAGLMGFRITVKYPDSQFKLKNVSGGSITKNGLFNTTVSDYNSVKNEFDVVWSNTEDVKENGTLFMLTFETKDYADFTENKIEFSYSQPDTFNSQYNPVELKCTPVTVKVVDAKTAAKNEDKTLDSTIKSGGQPVSDDYLIASVQAVMASFGEIDISNIVDESQRENVIKFVNSRNNAFSPDAKQYASFSELEKDYKQALTNVSTNNVLDSVDGRKVISTAEGVLQKYGANSFSELSEQDKSSAVDEALKGISDQGGDTSGFANVSDKQDAAKMLDGIVEGAQKEQNESISANQPKGNSKTLTIVLAISIILIVAAAVVAVVIIKKKKSKHE